MTNAAIYVRQSIDHAEGIERGLERTRKLVASKPGWVLVDEYVDNNVSATKARNSETDWARMLKDIKAGKIDVVVGVDIDRLLRSIADLVTLTELEVKVLTVDGEIDLTTADGEFRATMLAAIARFETRRKEERQRRAGNYRASQGEVFKGGRRAFGWKAGNVELEPTEAEWVRWLHREYLAGKSFNGMSRHLNDAGVSTTMGGRFSALQVKAILRRPRNAGILVHNGVVQEKSQIEPIVSLADHKAVLALLGTGGQRNVRVEEAWLSGVIKCACGERMTSRNFHRKGEAPSRRYECSQTLKTYKGVSLPAPGPHTGIPADIAEEKVTLTLYGLYTGGWLKAEQSGTADKIKALTERLEELAGEASAITEAYTLPGADKAVLRARAGEVESARAKVAAEIDTLRVGSLEATWLAKVMEQKEDSGAAALDFLAWFKGLEYDQRRTIAKSLDIQVAPGRGKGERVSVMPL